jgi:hypothetical protein
MKLPPRRTDQTAHELNTRREVLVFGSTSCSQ